MRSKPSPLLALVGAVILVMVACTPAPTSAPKPETAAAKSDAAPAKPSSVQPQGKDGAGLDRRCSTDSQRALADARARYYEAARVEGKPVMYGNTLFGSANRSFFDSLGPIFHWSRMS